MQFDKLIQRLNSSMSSFGPRESKGKPNTIDYQTYNDLNREINIHTAEDIKVGLRAHYLTRIGYILTYLITHFNIYVCM